MADFILLMHDDAAGAVKAEDWGPYLEALRRQGRLQGGSAIGPGVRLKKAADPQAAPSPLSGFIRLSADDLVQATALVAGNPVFEAGGTVEIRELPRTD